MTRLYFFDLREYKVNKKGILREIGGCPFAFFEEKARAESGERRLLTLCEGQLLFSAAREIFGEENPPKNIKKCEFGKLKFTNYGSFVDFSFSHSGDILALLISDECEVGVDIEIKKDEVHEGAQKRFLKDFTPNLVELKNIKLNFVSSLSFEKKDINEVENIKRCDPCEFLARWTALEATVKMSGDGLSAAKRVGEIAKKAELSSFSLSLFGEEYIVSIAKRKG